MTNLPPKADIHHLRKQAKAYFTALKRQAPQAQLADAQYALAREYGFSSWSRLKTAVTRQAAERWTARFQFQESYRVPAPSHRNWLNLDESNADDDVIATPLEIVWAHIGFVLLAVAIAMVLIAR